MQNKTLPGKMPNPEATYTVLEMHRLGFFPWIRSYPSLFRFVKRNLGELDPIIVRNEKHNTYRIPGAAIIRLQIKSQEKCQPSPSTGEKSPLTSILNDISTARTGKKSTR